MTEFNSSTIPQSNKHIESIPLGTWEDEYFPTPPADVRTPQEVFSGINKEERGALTYTQWRNQRSNNTTRNQMDKYLEEMEI